MITTNSPYQDKDVNKVVNQHPNTTSFKVIQCALEHDSQTSPLAFIRKSFQLKGISS